MLLVDCPWCEAPVAMADPRAIRCDGCQVEVEVDPAPVAAATAVAELALAA